jgi:hypothetical protein
VTQLLGQRLSAPAAADEVGSDQPEPGDDCDSPDRQGDRARQAEHRHRRRPDLGDPRDTEADREGVERDAWQRRTRSGLGRRVGRGGLDRLRMRGLQLAHS